MHKIRAMHTISQYLPYISYLNEKKKDRPQRAKKIEELMADMKNLLWNEPTEETLQTVKKDIDQWFIEKISPPQGCISFLGFQSNGWQNIRNIAGGLAAIGVEISLVSWFDLIQGVRSGFTFPIGITAGTCACIISVYACHIIHKRLPTPFPDQLALAWFLQKSLEFYRHKDEKNLRTCALPYYCLPKELLHDKEQKEEVIPKLISELPENSTMRKKLEYIKQADNPDLVRGWDRAETSSKNDSRKRKQPTYDREKAIQYYDDIEKELGVKLPAIEIDDHIISKHFLRGDAMLIDMSDKN